MLFGTGKKIKEMQKEIDALTTQQSQLLSDSSSSVVDTKSEYYELYRTNGLLRTIVTDPAERMTMNGFYVNMPQEENMERNSEINDAIQQDFKKYSLANKRRDMIKWARLYPEGSGIVPIIKAKSNSQGMTAAESISNPMPDKIKDIECFNVLDDPDDFTISTTNTSDPTRPDYNEPYYTISGQHPDESRMIWYINDWNADNQTGISVVDLSMMQ